MRLMICQSLHMWGSISPMSSVLWYLYKVQWFNLGWHFSSSKDMGKHFQYRYRWELKTKYSIFTNVDFKLFIFINLLLVFSSFFLEIPALLMFQSQIIWQGIFPEVIPSCTCAVAATTSMHQGQRNNWCTVYLRDQACKPAFLCGLYAQQ